MILRIANIQENLTEKLLFTGYRGGLNMKLSILLGTSVNPFPLFVNSSSYT